MSIILKAENISKQYRLGLVGSTTIKDDARRLWASMRGKEDPFLKVGAVNDRSSKAEQDYVWALKDINFDVKQGEVLGIIGKNGAGKSTLLKILSRVTAPTTGSIKTRGRIASLLEIGTGFHPELTGRENIFMNGAVLGMSKIEIRSKLDEIIAFSGCEKYIDTPVKRYSSGMTVRLGFAVAAHLEPEILVVDEVLAVGDAEFQKKAIGKMQDLSSGEGRTVLFVSHNMASIQNLCKRVLLLTDGRIEKEGITEAVIDHYLRIFRNNMTSMLLTNRTDREGVGNIKFIDQWFENLNGERTDSLYSGMSFMFVVIVRNHTAQKIKDVRFDIGIDDGQGRRLTILSNNLTNQELSLPPNKDTEIRLKINKLPLQSDRYSFTLFLSHQGNIEDWVVNAGAFDVENGDYFKTGKVIQKNQGNILLNHEFIL